MSVLRLLVFVLAFLIPLLAVVKCAGDESTENRDTEGVDEPSSALFSTHPPAIILACDRTKPGLRLSQRCGANSGCCPPNAQCQIYPNNGHEKHLCRCMEEFCSSEAGVCLPNISYSNVLSCEDLCQCANDDHNALCVNNRCECVSEPGTFLVRDPQGHISCGKDQEISNSEKSSTVGIVLVSIFIVVVVVVVVGYAGYKCWEEQRDARRHNPDGGGDEAERGEAAPPPAGSGEAATSDADTEPGEADPLRHLN